MLPEVLTSEQAKDVLDELQNDLIGDGEFDHILNKLEHLLSASEIRQRKIIDLRNALFVKANAPVSFPFLWDISQHDYVQWNGIVSNGGLGPIGRNAGEAIGVFATLDWQKKPGFSLYSLLGGQGFSSSHISYQSSINVRNLRHIEEQIKELESPQWPAMFPALDTARVARGKKLFEKQCATCHQDIDRSAKDRRVIAQMTKLKVLGTDQTMAQNSVSYEGYSGIVRGTNLDVGVGKMYIQERAPVAALLNSVTASVVATPDPDKWAISRFSEWVYDLVAAYFKNEVKTTLKRGNYNPDTTKDPFASLLAYKGRPLNGIWATAPYLHNGSVPTLYDLLLPKKRSNDPDDGDYRPDTFWVGHREFDPNKVGFVTDGKEGSFKFETHRKANSNAGHEYGARQFTEQDRWDLVAYMKSL